MMMLVYQRVEVSYVQTDPLRTHNRSETSTAAHFEAHPMVDTLVLFRYLT